MLCEDPGILKGGVHHDIYTLYLYHFNTNWGWININVSYWNLNLCSFVRFSHNSTKVTPMYQFYVSVFFLCTRWEQSKKYSILLYVHSNNPPPPDPPGVSDWLQPTSVLLLYACRAVSPVYRCPPPPLH